MTEYQARLILEFARCDMNASKLARELPCHRNTVQYQIDEIKRDTGIDPKSFYGLVELVERAKKMMEEQNEGQN